MADFRALLDDVIRRDVAVQLKLKHDINPQPIGPGKVEKYEVFAPYGMWSATAIDDLTKHEIHLGSYMSEAKAREEHPGATVKQDGDTEVFYKLITPAMIQQPSGQPKKIMMPLIFDPDSILWLSEGPLEADDAPVIEAPNGPGRRTPGGLHIGR